MAIQILAQPGLRSRIATILFVFKGINFHLLIELNELLKYRHNKNVLNNLRFFHHCYIIEVTFISTKEPNFKKDRNDLFILLL